MGTDSQGREALLSQITSGPIFEALKKDAGLAPLVKRHAIKALYERSLYDFGKAAWPILEPGRAFIPGKHIEAMCEHLEAVARGEIKKIVINVPPGTGKSIWSACFWPCWVWARNPEKRFIFASYKYDNSARDSRKRRDILGSTFYRKTWRQWRIKDDPNTVKRFENTAQGFMLTASVGGGSTGEHANVLVFDDPHDRMDRYSKAKREEAVNWYRTVFTSLNLGFENTVYVIIGQRICEDDLSGYVLAGELGYDHLCMPMLWEEGHQFCGKPTTIGWTDWRKAEGELLWPESVFGQAVEELKREKGSYDWSSQYQQRPAPDKGGVFSRDTFLYFRSSRESGEEVLKLTDRDGSERIVRACDCYWFQTADTALETNDDAAWTVVGTFAVTGSPVSLLVYDIARERLPVPKQYGFLIAQRRRHPRVVATYVEKKASGHGLLQEGAMRGTPFMALIAKGSKKQRSTPVATQYENGMVYHRVSTPWLDVFEGELLTFPFGAFLDQVDTLAYAGMIVQQQHFVASVADQSVAYMPDNPVDHEQNANGELAKPKWADLIPDLGGTMPANRMTQWGMD